MATRTDAATSASKPRTPKMATQATGITHPFLDRDPPFVFVFNPERWMVLDGRLVPSLHKLPLADGVNEVEVAKDGALRLAKLRARLEGEGRTVIPYTWAPDGESYLQCLDTRPGGGRNTVETWISVFEEARAGATETTPDESAYSQWLAKLVSSGKLPACASGVAQKMLERVSERLERALGLAAQLKGHGEAGIRAKALAAEKEVLAAYVATVKAEKAKAKAKRTPSVQDGEGGAA